MQALPANVKDMLKKIRPKIVGLIYVAFGLFLLGALATYHPLDPSLDVITKAAPKNAFKAAGAQTADMMIQFLGIAGFLVSAAFLFFGLLKIIGKKLSFFPLRLFTLLLTGLILSATAACYGFSRLASPLYSTEGLLGRKLKESLTLPAMTHDFLSFLALFFLFLLMTGLCLFSFGMLPKKIVWPFKKKVPAETEAMEDSTESTEEEDGDEEEETDGKTGKPIKKKTRKSVKKSKRQTAFVLPEATLLEEVKETKDFSLSKELLETLAEKLEKVFLEFGVEGCVTGFRPGPVVTLFEFEPAPGVKTVRIVNLADDVARSMAVKSVRIAVVPGQNVIGIELPNPKRKTVYLREMITDAFMKNAGKLTVILGKNIAGAPVFADLSKMPHLLVAGTTGSGKSVGINTMILSLLYRMTPDQLKMIMIDPKMLELSVYNGIPHLMTPVVTDPGKAVVALKWAVKEMETRYRNMSQMGVRNLEGYNQKLEQAAKSGEVLTRTVQTGFDDAGMPVFEEEELDLKPLPHLVIIVDEMADLMLVAGKEVEAAIQRLAQMARAAGIHLIMATQRPSVDVITGTIKANFPTRISFQVTSKIDSRTILGEQGAEQLLGKGDMLFMGSGERPLRVHGPFVSDAEVERVASFVASQQAPEYVDSITVEEQETPAGGGDTGGGGEASLYEQAVAIVVRDKKPSISYVQRQLRIGYNRAADLIDRMEREGVISAPNISGKREVLKGE